MLAPEIERYCREKGRRHGDGGFFYHRETGEVADVSLGDSLTKLLSGEEQPRWNSFNDFLMWFFRLEEESDSAM